MRGAPTKPSPQATVTAGRVGAEPPGPPPPPGGGNGAPGEDPGEGGRYVRSKSPIATTNLSVVWKVRDTLLGRDLAEKELKFDAPAASRARFLAEARLTASLAHPGVIPILDLVEGPTPYLRMPFMTWSTLETWIQARGPATTDVAERVRRMVAICDVLGFAHGDRRVLHLDLKPSNILVGHHGEVIVIDWGLACSTDAPEVRGLTPAYASPEQRAYRAEEIGPWSDVYSLGAVLYALLTARPPGPGGVAALPEGLAEVVGAALAQAPQRRPGTARELGAGLRAWLDGAWRQERADAAMARADVIGGEVAAARAESARLRAEGEALLDGIPASAPSDLRLPGWRIEDEAARTEARAVGREADRVTALYEALAYRDDHPGAHRALADWQVGRHREAERQGDRNLVALTERGILRHDREGRYAAYLRAAAALTLVTDPPGARVQLATYEERDRRLVAVPRGELGVTPLVAVEVPAGSHVLTITAPGRAPVTYPVYVERSDHWDGVPPGASAPWPIVLPGEGSLGEDERYVPAGWFVAGGAGGTDALPRRRLWVDAFVIRRHPLTLGEYLPLLAGESPDSPLLPRKPGGAVPIVVWREGAWQPDPAAGDPAAQLGVPVTWLSGDAAALVCGRLPGGPWRLPHEFEREKAGRGVDGRAFPWGSFADATWYGGRDAQAETVVVSPVDRWPLDVGPYGVRGMAGNLRDWCANDWFRAPPPDGARHDAAPRGVRTDLGVLRGGTSFGLPASCQLDARFAARRGQAGSATGVRPVRSGPPGVRS